jgi:hypothetical protein
MTLQKVCDLACTAVFLGLLIMPLALTSIETWNDAAENRRAAAAPSWQATSIANFPQQFDSYFNDHFGLRRTLIEFRNRIEFHAFRKSPSEVVVLGQGDMLFYAGEQSMAAYRGLLPLDDAALDRWNRALDTRRQWLSERGISYLFAIAPEKHSIYPELLPPHIRRGTSTPTDQVLERVRGTAVAANVADATPRLLAAKPDGNLYLKHDSHWNPRGGYIGYSTAMDALHRLDPTIPDTIALDADSFAPAPEQGGDLAMIIGRVTTADGGSTAQSPRLGCMTWEQSPPAAGTAAARGDFIGQCGMATSPARLLMFGDSFAGAMLPYLGPTFARVRASLRFPTLEELEKYVEEENPDVVIEERNERYLLLPP